MLLEDKVSLVQAYTGRMIRSASTGIPHPAVVVLRRYQSFRDRIRFNRQNVLARDGYTCQYCGVRLAVSELTYDHVVPRSSRWRRWRSDSSHAR